MEHFPVKFPLSQLMYPSAPKLCFLDSLDHGEAEHLGENLAIPGIPGFETNPDIRWEVTGLYQLILSQNHNIIQ